ncbi:hypothetical protein PV394_19430 [Streptomyces sp. NE06-03E]|uniref:hypothetical protein n=1 Tax=Streptomyces sp. NE06-03E TaxID=3028695 RepID=UPI0029A30528|nr:hypothetical protein [Streptomyces sp. NE06-03E]MDX3057290.1 hypothetical protein [Streptomyces sp. NE06-03E]
MPEQSNDVPPALYPELVASGGLAEALAREAARRGRRTGPPEPVEGYGPAVAACWAHGEARFAVYAANADVREFRIQTSGDSGRQTVYRWWSNKAEVLYEASAIDARHELSVPAGDGPRRGLKAYLDALVAFPLPRGRRLPRPHGRGPARRGRRRAARVPRHPRGERRGGRGGGP